MSASEQTSASKQYEDLKNSIQRFFQTLIARNYNNPGQWHNERQQYNFELIQELEALLIEHNSRPSPQQQPDTLSFDEACKVVAQKHGLGSTLVTGHRVQYFKEAHELAKGQPDELYKAPKCPKCGSDKIAMFDDNDDHCLKCGSIFSAVISNSNTVAQLRAEVEKEKADAEKWYKKYNEMSETAFRSANKASDQAEEIKRLKEALNPTEEEENSAIEAGQHLDGSDEYERGFLNAIHWLRSRSENVLKS